MNFRDFFSRFAATLLFIPAIGAGASPTASVTFNSKLDFTVWCESGPAWLDAWKSLGTTPAKEAIQIPDCDAWGLQPEEKTTFAQAVTEAIAAHATGVASTYWAPATDQDLLVLKQQMPGLRVLHLWESPGITDAGLAELKNFTGLKHLGLQHCNTITDAGLARLKDIPELQSLEIGFCAKISPSGLAALRETATLRELELMGDNIDDAAVARITNFEHLETLNLSWCAHLTDAGLAALKEMKALRSLNLAKTPITDAGLAHLQQLTGLQSLNLRACVNLTAAAVADLRRALPSTTIDY